MELIDKSAVVAEIERRIKEIPKEETDKALKAVYGNEAFVLTDLLSFLDTIEVKDVDLEKEIDKWWCSLYTDYSMMWVPNHKFVPEPAYIDSNFKQSEMGKTKIAFELCMDWKVDSDDIEWDADTIRNFAKHFFELGLKAQKGE